MFFDQLVRLGCNSPDDLPCGKNLTDQTDRLTRRKWKALDVTLDIIRRGNSSVAEKIRTKFTVGSIGPLGLAR